MKRPDKARQTAERILYESALSGIGEDDEKRLASRIARAIRAGYERGKVDGRRSVPVCGCDCVKLEAVAEAAREVQAAWTSVFAESLELSEAHEALADALAALEAT